MNDELIIKKCKNCGAIIKVLKDCECPSCGIICCGEKMMKLLPNTVDAVVEKHVPTYEIKDDKIFIKVNHVMENEHYIEWISMVKKDKEFVKYFKPGDICEVSFNYIKDATLYAYCNKHGLWSSKVK